MKRRDFIRTTATALTTVALAKNCRSEQKASRYRVGIIGRTGRGDYGHGIDTVWKDINRAEIVAVADENPQGREKAAKRLNAPRTYADYREMLRKERPQIVSVAPRWLDCHRDMVLACADAGCHVLMEKPMCRTPAEADEMIAALEAKKLKLAIAHQTRYSPVTDRVRELIAAGTIGRVLEIRGRGKEDRRSGGEDMMVLGSHIMDLMRLLAGEPQWCFARVFEGGRPVTKDHIRDGNEGIGLLAGDEVHATYRFDNGVMGYFSTLRSKDGAGERFGVWIYGTKGIITLNTGSLPAAWLCEDPSWQPGRSNARWTAITSAGLGKPETLNSPENATLGNRLIATDLIRAIETDTQPKGSAYDGRAALEMILATYESHRLTAPVALPMKNRQHPLSLM